MRFDLDSLVRENIKRLVPYSSARDEYAGTASVFLDANENSFGSPLDRNYNRYPDPKQLEIKQRLAEIKGVGPEQIFVGNGSDEAIDLIVRIFCRPGLDSILICPPTYGMYEVAAAVNDVAVKKVKLASAFDLDVNEIKNAVDAITKVIFLCSPNNPTGSSMSLDAILEVASSFQGIVVVDEAYIDFSSEPSLVSEIERNPNLVVLQTFSKAWGLAGLRVGLAYASSEIIKFMNRAKPPYNVSQVAQEMILDALDRQQQVKQTVNEILNERRVLSDSLGRLPFVTNVYPSDTNFILVKTAAADEIYRFLLSEKIVIRNRSTVELCEGCLRITVGTPEENAELLEALEKYQASRS